MYVGCCSSFQFLFKQVIQVHGTLVIETGGFVLQLTVGVGRIKCMHSRLDIQTFVLHEHLDHGIRQALDHELLVDIMLFLLRHLS